MGLKYTRARGSLGGGDYRRMAGQLQNIIEEELDVVGKRGEEKGQEWIDSRGTGNTWSRPWGGRTGSTPGRVDSETMKKAIDYRIIRGKGVGLDVGWVHIYHEYFGLQDKGFTGAGQNHNIAVAGMGVIADLNIFMRNEVDRAMDKATRRIVDGL